MDHYQEIFTSNFDEAVGLIAAGHELVEINRVNNIDLPTFHIRGENLVDDRYNLEVGQLLVNANKLRRVHKYLKTQLAVFECIDFDLRSYSPPKFSF